uniref:Glutamate receptor n=1 Tax=Kalanchoe fedtschenkoi TaxID=63787 RepID=A0A7N0ZUP4_KALFE
MGFQTWQAGAVTVDLSRKHRVPMLSLAEEVPSWATREWPFLINAARSQRAQAEAVVAIINSWNWRRVTIVYEDTGSSPDAIISHLINELQDAQVFIEELASLSSWLAFSDEQYLQRQLESLKAKQSRVFIVHTSAVNLSSNIFIEAKKLGMMENDSVWITTTSITNQLYSLDETTISAMQGVLGVKSYFPTSGDRWNSFSSNFSVLFKSLYPNEPDREPGLYALQAYDAMWALALAVSNSSGQFLLDKISRCNFQGLNGEFKLSRGGGLEAQKVFAIVNVDGKSYRELGYWSDGLGFSLNLTEGSNYSKFMDILPPVRFWPGEAWPVPKGYTTPTDANPLIVGVPAHPAFDDIVKVHCDNESSCMNPNVTGFSVDVFKAAVARLPYNLSYKFVPYFGTYKAMIQELQNQTFQAQAVIGDISITAQRCQLAQFTQPYSEPGLQAVIYQKPQPRNKSWLFQKPFTGPMWIFTGLVNIYNGLVVFLIERRHNPAFRGSVWNQIGTLINLAFTTLFSLQGGTLHSNMSRMTMLVWLFVALVVTQSYTASLTSMLTVHKLNTQKLDMNELMRHEQKVGCNWNSFVCDYLKVLGFREDKILKVYNADDYPQLLKNGTIKAAFLITPYAKILLARTCQCQHYTTAEPTFRIGGFGFVFKKGDPLLPDMSQAVLNVSESGEVRSLETKMLSKYNCTESQPNNDDEGRLGMRSFKGLFAITFATSTAALVAYCVSRLHENWVRKNSRVGTELQAEAGRHAHGPREDEAIMFANEMETYKRY